MEPQAQRGWLTGRIPLVDSALELDDLRELCNELEFVVREQAGGLRLYPRMPPSELGPFFLGRVRVELTPSHVAYRISAARLLGTRLGLPALVALLFGAVNRDPGEVVAATAFVAAYTVLWFPCVFAAQRRAFSGALQSTVNAHRRPRVAVPSLKEPIVLENRAMREAVHALHFHPRDGLPILACTESEAGPAKLRRDRKQRRWVAELE